MIFPTRTRFSQLPRALMTIVLGGWFIGRLHAADPPKASSGPSKFPCDPAAAAHYTAHRVSEPITIDGKLEENAWKLAPRSARFVDILTGKPTMYDTRTAVLWDDENLYVGFWVEEPNVAGTLTERDSPIYTNNDVE